MTCGLVYFCKDRGTLGEFLKTATFISLSTSIRDRYLVLMTAKAKNPASHKYDEAKETRIRNAFFVKAGYSSFNNPKICQIG